MKNFLFFASKLATTLPLAIVVVSTISSSAMAQVDTSAAAVGAQNWTNNNATGSQASQGYGLRGNTMVGRMGSYGVGLQPAWNAVQAPYSNLGTSYSSGSFNYGFQGTGFNNMGATGGQSLPTCSTGSVDANIVENTNYSLYGGSGGIQINQLPSILPLSSAGTALVNSAASAAATVNALQQAIPLP